MTNKTGDAIKPHKLPRQEDVEFVDLGSASAAVVRLTPENRQSVFEDVMSTYLNDVCRYCDHSFTREEIDDAVWAPGDKGRIAHKECWDKNKSEVLP
jgi:hypothetical protein